MSALVAALAGLFSSSKVQDLGIEAIKKMGGLDGMDAKEKADYILNYIAATKHQSPTRRFIALLITSVYVLMILTWLVSAGVGYNVGYTPALEFAGAVKMFMESVLTYPVNIVLGFYFIVNIAQKAGK